MDIEIAGKLIGPGQQVFLVAEVGQAHEGSLGIAHSYIDAVSDVGVDAIKFQTHLAHAESTRDDSFRIKFSRQDTNRYEYWKRMEFSESQWEKLALHADKKGLVFLSSPFSLTSLRILLDIGVPAIKLASGELYNPELISAILEANIPIFVSTGMSSWSDIDTAIEHFKSTDAKIILMQCTSKYPTQLKDVGLNIINEMEQKYDCPIGLSDHSGSIYPGLAGISQNIAALEVHVTFHKHMFGPDVSSSLDLRELETLVKHRDAMHIMNRNPVDKTQMAKDLNNMRLLFSRSIAPKSKITKGQIISSDSLTLKKPGTGISGSDMSELIGKRAKQDIEADQLIEWDFLED